MSSAPPPTRPSRPGVRTRPASRAHPHRLPLAGVLRLNAPSDIWFKPALSVVAATAVPHLTLLALDRLDLVMYTMAGSFCALYTHQLPYAARARALAWVVAGMAASVAVALTAAALAPGAAVLVAVGALLAAAQKALCDATRVGPPGHLILTFVSSASLFAPQRLGQVPGHLALTLGAGALAWLVCMAPAPLRPHGPERRATARALRASAAYADAVAAAAPDDPGEAAARARAAAAAAVHAAWQALHATRTDPVRAALHHLAATAEEALAAPGAADAARLRRLADALRGAGAVPSAGPAPLHPPLERAEAAEAAVPLWRRFAPGSPHLPIAMRTAVGCALAGYAALALGVGRPYWALVTAASLYQANVTLTWSRGVQRVVGNVLGVAAFAALAPLAHLNHAALIGCGLLCAFGAEALISRNYWLGSVCVTPMALLVTEFGRFQDPGALIADRVVDTLIGALCGLAAAVAVTNRRAADHIEHALAAAERARAHAERALSGPAPELSRARRRLTASLVALRAAHDTAAGEWWQRELPGRRVADAEQAGHRTLAATVRGTTRSAEGARP
ncbi:FUSC family protein [Streptomyces longispororuber]|uniref:FUSC family protein n=1 Tax=Streptomyces longispororuber TaxID=68230 RepID=UPI0033E41316